MMMVMKIIIVVVVSTGCFILPKSVLTLDEDASQLRYNSLLSAQCKARCLYEYRSDSSSYHQQRSLSSVDPDGKSHRLLANHPSILPWRSIWERCPRLLTCSSCLIPCDLDPPLLLANEQTCQAICSSSKTNECQRSCQFIRFLYQHGSDCSSISSIDCSDKVPKIFNVTAMERKSRRTVRLKWNANGMNDDEPIFYVIEAQWKIPKTPQYSHDLISKWGFLKEEVSQNKAILRNIQRDQRWYFFRVAAVTRHGHSSFVSTNKPFRLTTESRKSSSLIEAPKNFSVKDLKIHFNQMNVTLMWQSPDEPVDGYQITWEEENSSHQQSVNLSSLETTIPFLSLDKSYLFKIRSMIITEGDQKQMSLPELLHFHSPEQFYSIRQFQISSPYFDNGLIRTNLSWSTILDERVKQYDLSWIETECSSELFSCCYQRDAVTTQNTFQLYDLRYNCSYRLIIRPIGIDIPFNRSFQWDFNVSSCHLTQSQGPIVPPCHLDRKSIDIFTSLPPVDLLVIRNQSGLTFSWQTIHSSIHHLRYRLNIEQMVNHLEIFAEDFSPKITSFYLPFSSKHRWERYLNVTLSLMDHNAIRQQQSIIIDHQQNDNDDDNFFLISSSSSSAKSTTIQLFLFLGIFHGI